MASYLEDFSPRLSYGARTDILPLVRIGSEMTNARARIFLREGLTDAQTVVQAGLTRITDILVRSLPYANKQVISANLMPKTTGSGEQFQNIGEQDNRDETSRQKKCYENFPSNLISKSTQSSDRHSGNISAAANSFEPNSLKKQLKINNPHQLSCARLARKIISHAKDLLLSEIDRITNDC